MQLRDQGKLRLDDPVSRYLPWFAVPNPFPNAPEITIRHLLTHTAGFCYGWDTSHVDSLYAQAASEGINNLRQSGLRKVMQGITVDDENLVVDVINAVGPGGDHLMQAHTMKYMKTEYFNGNGVTDTKNLDMGMKSKNFSGEIPSM